MLFISFSSQQMSFEWMAIQMGLVLLMNVVVFSLYDNLIKTLQENMESKMIIAQNRHYQNE